MSDELIAVTGATGGVGGRVAQRLADAGIPQRLVVRDPGRAPHLAGAEVAGASYEDREAMRAALAGTHTLFLVSAHEHPDRVGLHAAVIDAGLAAGVTRVVYASFLNAAPGATFTFARDHFHTEEHIRRAGLAHTFLRSSLYIDVLPFFAGRERVIRGPAGDGRFAPVARDDIAEVAAAVLREPATHDGHTYDLTGPARLTMTQVAVELTQAAGRPVRYEAETIEQAYESRAHYGAPEWAVTGWVTSYAAVATGELDVVSEAVHTVTGHPPMGLDEWLAANPESLRRLREGA